MVLPATTGQHFLWLLGRYRRCRGALGLPVLLRLRGPLDVGCLEGALDDVAARHPALRTVFAVRDGRLHRVVAPAETAAVALASADVTSAADPLGAADAQIRDFLRADPDLATGPLRTGRWRIGSDDHLLVLNPHHAVTDAWSNLVLVRDLTLLYNARRAGSTARLPVLAPAEDHEAPARPTGRPGERATARDRLAGLLRGARFPDLAPPVDRAQGQPLADVEWFGLDRELAGALEAVAREAGAGLSVVLLTLFLSVLREASGQDRVAACAVRSERTDPRLRDTVGFLAQTVVVPFTAGPGLGSDPLAAIHEVRDDVRAGLNDRSAWASLPPNAWAKSGFGRPEDAVFHLYPDPGDVDPGQCGLTDLTVTPYRQPDGVGSRFELQMVIVPGRDGLLGSIRFAPDRFSRSMVRGLVAAYRSAAAELAAARLRRTP